MARRDAAGTVYYYFADHLGSSRVITNATGTVCYEADFYPYGGERAVTTTCSQNYKFTGKERETETGNDNFGARYYPNNLGRFMTVDPRSITSQRMLDPQQWNMYAYTRNNPLKFYDPDGMELRLAAGLDQRTQDRIIKDLVETYRRPTGRAGLETLDISPIKFTVGTGRFRDQRVGNQIRRIFGKTVSTGLVGTMSPDGKTAATVDQSKSSVEITYDFKKLDSAGQEAPPEKKLFNHELGHAVDAATDPVAYRNKTQGEGEDTADDFAEKVQQEKADMPKDAAEKAVQRILGIPAFPCASDNTQNCGPYRN